MSSNQATGFSGPCVITPIDKHIFRAHKTKAVNHEIVISNNSSFTPVSMYKKPGW